MFLCFSADMSWDFFVPVCTGDLVKTGGINQYVVQDVVSPKQLPSSLSRKYYIRIAKLWKWAAAFSETFSLELKPTFYFCISLTGFKAALRSQGPLCILEHFDTCYSVLQ